MTRRRIIIGLTAVLVTAAGATAGATAATAESRESRACTDKPSAIYVPACGAWHGLATNPAHQNLPAFEQQIGRKVHLWHDYLTFNSHDTPGKAFPNATARDAINGGRMYFFNLKPRASSGTPYPWRDVANGTHDVALKQLMQNIKTWAATAGGKKVFLGFHHEPEDEVGTVYGSAADFVAAYKHVYNMSVSGGVRQNLIFAWGVTGYMTRVDQWNSLYPGDAYVDWLAYDPYGGLCNNTYAPTTFAKALGESTGTDVDDTGKARFYKWANGVGSVENGVTYRKPGAVNKPIMLGEWATKGANGGSEPTQTQFYADAKAQIVDQGRYPNIKAYVHWQGQDALCHTFIGRPTALRSYQNLVGTPYFNPVRPY